MAKTKKHHLPPISEPGTPTRIEEDGDTNTPIRALDEEAFMLEVCDRMNNFIATYPNEAQSALAMFIPYQEELAWVHRQMSPDTKPGATVAAFFAGVFQTQHGRGWVLSPVLDRANRNILRFEVKRQEPPEDWPLETV